MATVLEPRERTTVLDVEGTLQAPVRDELRQHVQGLLSRGERQIALDLSRLSDIDAAGVGELVRLFNMTAAAGAALQISRANRRVRHLLRLVGVLGLLERDQLL
jgi:anti-anti-sigma factor